MTTLNWIGLAMLIIPLVGMLVCSVAYFVYILVAEAFDEDTNNGIITVCLIGYAIAAGLLLGTS
jgi:hypothetical protein